MNHYIGIDVAKATLQVYIPKNETDFGVANSPTGLKSLYSRLKKQCKKEIGDVVFVYESTGSYSTVLEHFCQGRNIRCFKVGAYQSASFAKTVKNRNKSDKVDARMLSRMHILATDADIKIPSRDENAHQMRALIKYYQWLLKEKMRLTSYLEAATFNLEDTHVLKSVKKRIAAIKKEQKELIEKIMDVIHANPAYREAFKNICSIDGIGQKSGIILLYLFLRYPEASRQQITALCGLDPIVKESGTSVKHKSRISKQGLSLGRDMLFMPTLCATMHNEAMRHFYVGLLQRGKPKILAQIAAMRKLVLLAHSLYKNKQSYDPRRYLKFTQCERKISMN